ncbi:MAG TPA: cyclic nucleotide-binding domain-containing protein [Arenibaculum sp.]|nr:cyclic nucleotide-binding domain-containing protein [Arenibaculum sp.]
MTIVDEAEVLQRNDLFSAIDPGKLKLLAFSSEKLRFAPGESVFRREEPGSAGFLILEGQAELVIETPCGRKAFSRHGKGELLGMISMLVDVPRSGTCVAVSDLTVLCIARECYMHLMTAYPKLAIATTQVLAHRLNDLLLLLQDSALETAVHARAVGCRAGSG